jgi:hypothetical protein
VPAPMSMTRSPGGTRASATIRSAHRGDSWCHPHRVCPEAGTTHHHESGHGRDPTAARHAERRRFRACADRHAVSAHGGQCCREAELCGWGLRCKSRTVRCPPACLSTRPLIAQRGWRAPA